MGSSDDKRHLARRYSHDPPELLLASLETGTNSPLPRLGQLTLADSLRRTTDSLAMLVASPR